MPRRSRATRSERGTFSGCYVPVRFLAPRESWSCDPHRCAERTNFWRNGQPFVRRCAGRSIQPASRESERATRRPTMDRRVLRLFVRRRHRRVGPRARRGDADTKKPGRRMPPGLLVASNWNGRLLEVVLELPRPRRVAQLAQRLRLDLPDPLSGDVELLADLLERPGTPVLESEAELEHASLPTGQRVEHRLDLLLEELVRCGLGGSEGTAVLDEVTEVRVLFLTDRGLERDRLLRDLDDLADLLRRD